MHGMSGNLSPNPFAGFLDIDPASMTGQGNMDHSIVPLLEALGKRVWFCHWDTRD